MDDNMREDIWQHSTGSQTHDVGWYPDGDPSGAFVVRTVEGEDWEGPVSLRTRNLSDVLNWVYIRALQDACELLSCGTGINGPLCSCGGCHLKAKILALRTSQKRHKAEDKLRAAFGNARFVFGLKAQGHIPTIEQALAEGKTWEEIGKLINWCPKTAEEHYGWYLEEKEA